MMHEGVRQFLLAGAALFLIGALIMGRWLMQDLQSQERYDNRIRRIHGEDTGDDNGMEHAAVYRESFARSISQVGQKILTSGIVPAATKGQVETMLRSAGIRGDQAVGVFFGAKLLMLIGLPLIGWIAARHFDAGDVLTTFIPIASGIVGLLVPDMIVSRMRNGFTARLEKGLPDALDMMVICAQAGLGLGTAVVRVAEEMRVSYRDLAIEFALTANELQIMSDTKIALLNLGNRTGLEQFRRLATTLIQTIQYGTPLSEALRTLSAEMRQEALTKFEESAARLPTMLTLPMIIFILPCVFMIAGGPAVVQLMHALK